MCGIFGAIHLNNNNHDNKNEISELIELFRYRGPNQKGTYIDKKVSFAHVRLSIIDLSKSASQPMMDIEEENVIIFNGEIYNYEEIKKELIYLGYKFKTNSDTEVIIAAIKEYGESAVLKFNGMFAFAVYSKKTGVIHIFRDRFGIKPLYYFFGNNKVVFASEPKLIVKYVKEFDFKLNPLSVSSFISYRYPLDELSFFKGIKTLKSGHFIKIENDKFTVKKYYELPTRLYIEDKGEDYYIERIRELIESSIKYRIISDVPYGAYLSGGVDSSIIVALMSKYSPYPVKTFTIGFSEQDYNEFYYAKIIAKLYKTEHYEIEADFKTYTEAHKKISSRKGSPVGVPNEPLIYILSKYLRQHITVVLSGEGADELFGGYGKIFRSPADYEKIQFFNSIIKNKREIDDKKLLNKLREKYGNITTINSPLKHFLSLYQYIKFEEKKKIFSEDFLNSIGEDRELTNIFKSKFSELGLKDLCRLYMIIFEKIHLQGLLLRLDNATMGASVEGRIPFLDHRLVEEIINIPTKYKLKWKSKLHNLSSLNKISDEISEKLDIPKYILKKAFEKELPNKILYRKKMGFPVPLENWKEKFYKEELKEILLYDKTARERGIYNIEGIKKALSEGKRNSPRLIWLLVSLELWLKNYYDKF
jgi:asparagine synthase (glutamine-hydrolysing)